MRKIIAGLLSMSLLLAGSVMSYAAEVKEDGGVQRAAVYVKTVRNIAGEHSTDLEHGQGSVRVDDETTVTAKNAPEGAARLVVTPIPSEEEEAWNWIKGCMDGTGRAVHTFDIYFEDADGNRIDADGAEVTIQCTHCESTPMVCSLTTSGTVQVLSHNDVSGAVTFRTNGSSYYIMAEKLATPGGSEKPAGTETPAGTEAPAGTETPTAGADHNQSAAGSNQAAPKTDDDSLFWNWAVAVTASVLVLAVAKRRKEKC